VLRADLALDPAYQVGPLDRRLFGTFVEHMGRCVYTGIYEPAHPTADADGFRGDVLELVRELGASTVRYPGGNFVSGYRWEDGVGPRPSRPRRLDLAWRSIETNEIGLNEFVLWARRAGLEPMIALNLGTRGVQEACDLVEYANHPAGTRLSDLRRGHGVAEPHGVKLWCLGNEVDGQWQIGHKTADEYGRLAAETAKAMRMIDPSIELVACGSSNGSMPTFGAWESTVLEHTYDSVDYISLHGYWEEVDGDLGSFLASAVDMDRSIETVVATADQVGARLRSTKRIRISFDEWGVFQPGLLHQPPEPWQVAPPLIEAEYSLADAVVAGDLLISLLRHADRVGIACHAQLVNVIAPIRTRAGGPAWRQTIFHPFSITSRLARGTVLRADVQGPTYTTLRYGDVPVVDATAIWDEGSGGIVLLAVNRGQASVVELTVDLTGFHGFELAGVITLAGRDVRATNTAAEQDRVTPRDGTAKVRADSLALTLPAVSWSAIRLRTAERIRATA
jgi:alpha-L-arabinofuranosidase